MVKPPIVWGTLSFCEEGRPDQKKTDWGVGGVGERERVKERSGLTE